MGMFKLCRRVYFLQFLLELVYAEVIHSHRNIMEQYDTIIGQFGQPTFIIMLNCFISVKSVNMQKVNAVVFKRTYSLVKSHSE